MNADFLSDAMNEISDSHIAEAATFEPKVKVIPWKKIFAAACIIAVAISALFVYNFLLKPSVQNGDAATYNSTSFAETTKAAFSSASVIQAAPPVDYDNWENENLTWYFLGVNIDGTEYMGDSSFSEPVDKSILLRELGRITVYDYVKEENEYIDLIVYEVKGISKDYAVAVGREDGLMRGTFLYIANEVFYGSETIGVIIDKLNLREEVISIPKNTEGYYFKYYNYDGSEEYVEGDRIILDENQIDSFCKKFLELLGNSRFCIREDNNWGETPTLSFDMRIYGGFNLSVEITTDGYITIESFHTFKVSEEKCKEFISLVTQLGLPQDFDIEKEIANCKTLGELTEIYSLSVQSSYSMTYYKQSEDGIIYSLCVETRNLIDELLRRNSDSEAISRTSDCAEKLVFDTSVNGDVKPEIYLCDDGYLYVSCKSVNKGFYIGEEEYEAFMNDFKKIACIYSDEEPVTLA